MLLVPCVRLNALLVGTGLNPLPSLYKGEALVWWTGRLVFLLVNLNLASRASGSPGGTMEKTASPWEGPEGSRDSVVQPVEWSYWDRLAAFGVCPGPASVSDIGSSAW